MDGIGFGLIGTGYMGRAHAIALHAVGSVFGQGPRPRCVLLADSDARRAAASAAALGFERHTGDWQALIEDPAVQVVDICTPNHLHHAMALAAIRAGKHVYCEKPLALDVAEAQSLAAAARAAGVVHAVGLNYTCNPLLQQAREIIAAGEIGTPLHFAGRYFEDYMADPAAPFTWRCERRLAGGGALADLGSHLIDLLRFLLGPVARVNATLRTVIPERRDAAGVLRRVENEDIAQVLAELQNGLPATLEISRVATGRKCGLAFELFGSHGSLAFDQERMNELRLYKAGQQAGRLGYTTLLAGPQHPDYAAFCPAPGHGLGINDLKIIELRNLLRAIAGEAPFAPDFDEGVRVQRVMSAIERSAAERAWVDA